MSLKNRIRHSGYVTGSGFPPLWRAILGLPVVALCKLNGWTRDAHGRLYRHTRPSDPPSALFHGKFSVWFEDRAPGGERVVTWSYRHAWLFDVGALGALIGEQA